MASMYRHGFRNFSQHVRRVGGYQDVRALSGFSARSYHSAGHMTRSPIVLLSPQHRSALGCLSPALIRCNSSQSTDATLQTEYIPEPPSVPGDPSLGDVAGQVVDPLLQLNALGEASLASQGLGGWWPPGLMQHALEWLHVTCDLPWWGAIIAGTCVVRCLMFPVVIKAQQNAAKMHNNMPTVTRLQDRFSKARMGGNPVEAARSGHELYDFMNRNGINPMKSFLPPLAQIPIFVSVFIGLRRMANLPVESMKLGGVAWFADLTVPDPFYLMPILTSLTFFLTVEVGTDGAKASSMGHTVKWVMRILPFAIFPMLINFPAAMLVYWLTSNTFSLAQVTFLRRPRIRQMFNIEELVTHPVANLPRKRGFLEGFKESWDNAKLTQTMEDRARVDSLKFKEAGKGPLVKTFAHDPTKPGRKQP